ncbi:MAG: CBS domain-containing protein [Gammaproteobacteria bacterium]|nr:CBS domain-containing protein [Gammaproteobacteria bacterium]
MIHDINGGADTPSLRDGNNNVPELELSDEDILDAMAEISGYLDVSTEDFRLLYHLAHRHALARVFKNMRADRLMRTGFESLQPSMTLEAAAAAMSRQGMSGLPVVNSDGQIVGMLTETDFLRWLRADTFMELLLRLSDAPDSFALLGKETPVCAIMTADVATLERDSGFIDIVGAFHAHEGRGMPVVDDKGCLLGMLTRDDFLKACHLEGLL